MESGSRKGCPETSAILSKKYFFNHIKPAIKSGTFMRDAVIAGA